VSGTNDGDGRGLVVGSARICPTAAEAVEGINDGAAILVHSFGPPQSWPTDLMLALRERRVRNLTIICNSPAAGPTSLQILAEEHQIKKLICTYAILPVTKTPIEEQIKSGEIEVELVPQGTLTERVRAAGAGLAGFYTPTGVGTLIADGKEERVFDGRRYVFERALAADFAFVRADRADASGNLTYRRGARNFGPIWAMAARHTIAEVTTVVANGALDPEMVHTPGIFVDRVVCTTQHFDPGVIAQITRSAGRSRAMNGRAVGDAGNLGLPPDLMAMRVAALLRPGEYVNLGLGLPTLVSNFIAGRDVTLHSENGILGYGAFPEEGEEDLDLYNASGQLVTAQPGTSFFDSAVSFAMARNGRVSSVVLGGFQVAQNGDLANWRVPASGAGGIGGAMDLAAGGARVIVIMHQLDRDGRSKLVERLSYPPTARGCVKHVVTDLAYFDLDSEGFLLREIAPGVGLDEVRRGCAAALRVARDVREMHFA
jgi:3-oxoacid CoA-transferase